MTNAREVGSHECGEGGSDECAVGRLKCTEEMWDARGSLLLSVKIEVVAGCGDPLPLGLQPRDVWIRTHWNGRWLWRHVKTNEMFWEDSPGAWRKYSDGEYRHWWGSSWTGQFFYESTGTTRGALLERHC